MKNVTEKNNNIRAMSRKHKSNTTMLTIIAALIISPMVLLLLLHERHEEMMFASYMGSSTNVITVGLHGDSQWLSQHWYNIHTRTQVCTRLQTTST